MTPVIRQCSGKFKSEKLKEHSKNNTPLLGYIPYFRTCLLKKACTNIRHPRPMFGTKKTFCGVSMGSKATRSLLLVKMIAKLESNINQYIPKQRPTNSPHNKQEVHKTINQQQQNHRPRTDSSLSRKGAG